VLINAQPTLRSWDNYIENAGYAPHGLSISIHMDSFICSFYSWMGTCLLP